MTAVGEKASEIMCTYGYQYQNWGNIAMPATQRNATQSKSEPGKRED